MTTPRPALRLVSPLPPARTGIADYAARLAEALAADYAVESGDAAPPPRRLYQLGNNPDHAEALRWLRRWPGVVTLHDPSLMWLHQQLGEPLRPGLAAPAGSAQARLAARRGRQLASGEALGRADHLLFDHAGGVLAASRAVVVHSRFAAARLRLLHGAAATQRVEVIPHLLPPVRAVPRAAARQMLGLPAEGFILGSAGFPHPAKRLGWLAAALAQARAAGAAVHFLHAGAADPALPSGSATGWLEEAALDLHLAACDALVCLHFPSHGEASGVLARGLALGVACLVADTGGYAELPRDAVLHLPVPHTVPALAAAISALAANPARAWALGAAGQRFAGREMALPVVAARYRQVIEASLHHEPRPAPPCETLLELPASASPAQVEALLAPHGGRCRLLLSTPSLAALAALSLETPALLHALLPPWVALRGVRVQAPPAQPGLLLDLTLP